MVTSEFYVLEADGSQLAGPFADEVMAYEWLTEHPFDDAFVMTTGACDIG